MLDLFNQPPIERHYNNAESAAMETKENRKRWNAQCERVYTAMMQGERLTNEAAQAQLKYKVGDLRKRVSELINTHRIPVKHFDRKSGFREFYLDSEYIEKNKK